MKALLAIDGSTESTFGLETAVSLAWPSDAEVLVLTVFPPESEWFGGPWASASPTSLRTTSVTSCAPSGRRFWQISMPSSRALASSRPVPSAHGRDGVGRRRLSG